MQSKDIFIFQLTNLALSLLCFFALLPAFDFVKVQVASKREADQQQNEGTFEAHPIFSGDGLQPKFL